MLDSDLGIHSEFSDVYQAIDACHAEIERQKALISESLRQLPPLVVVKEWAGGATFTTGGSLPPGYRLFYRIGYQEYGLAREASKATLLRSVRDAKYILGTFQENHRDKRSQYRIALASEFE